MQNYLSDIIKQLDTELMLIAVNFHYVRESYDLPYKSIFGHTPKSFRSQVEKLNKLGSFVSQKQIIDHLNFGKSIPSNSILLTFDDGLKEQYEIANQILKEMGIPALYFVNPSNVIDNKVSTVHQIHLLRSYIQTKQMSAYVKKETGDFTLSAIEKSKAEKHYNYDEKAVAHFKYALNFKLDYQKKAKLIQILFDNYFNNEEKSASDLYMNLEQIKSLAKSGELGSHTFNHLPLGKININDAKLQITKAQDFFIKFVGSHAQAISYPYGSYESVNKKIADFARIAGLKFGFTMERVANKELNRDPLILGRYDCNDLPGGKNNLFKNGNIFSESKERAWVFE